MNEFLCKLTGGHKYVPETDKMKFSHIIDGMYKVKSTCIKCGHLRVDLLSLPGSEWTDNYERIKAYEDRSKDDSDIS